MRRGKIKDDNDMSYDEKSKCNVYNKLRNLPVNENIEICITEEKGRSSKDLKDHLTNISEEYYENNDKSNEKLVINTNKDEDLGQNVLGKTIVKGQVEDMELHSDSFKGKLLIDESTKELSKEGRER